VKRFQYGQNRAKGKRAPAGQAASAKAFGKAKLL
jgi:hypothetical protein